MSGVGTWERGKEWLSHIIKMRGEVLVANQVSTAFHAAERH